MKAKLIAWGLILTGSVVLIYAGTCFYAGVSMCLGRTYTKKDLIANYQLKSKEINEVKTYINSIVPAGKKVFIEFEGN
ncbi:MAG TPA: hypothetical protein VFU15_04935, partial [Bacteroidia bacterium]|nr:hypothetical protein [Bacteroidia bacterium]